VNILIVTESFPPHAGGSGWSTYYLCKSLKENKHNVVVAKINGKENIYNGIEIIPIKKRKNIKKIITEKKIDLVHTQHMKSTMLAKNLKIPTVVTIRDYWPLSYDGTLFNNCTIKNVDKGDYFYNLKNLYANENKLIKLLSPLLAIYMLHRTKKALKIIKRANKIICVSNFVKKKMGGEIKKEKLIVINNLIDYSTLEKIKPKKFKKRTVVFVGKLIPSKGAQILPESLKKIPNIQLILIGEGNLKDDIAKKCKKYKIDYKFMNYLKNDDVLSYIKGADIFVVPSLWHEPLGRTILEGLGVGAKIIATSTGGTPEIIRDNHNGLLFDGSSNRLNQKIKYLLQNKGLMDKLSNNAKESAKDKFDQNVLIKKFENVYLSLIK
jgi:glycogen synthase